MSQPQFSRRRFLQQAGGAAAWGLTTPAFVPAAALGRGARSAPSERIAVGMLGTGRQAFLVNLGRQLLDMPDVQVVALCDVDRWRLNETKELVSKRYGQASASGSYEG
jgi:hypothetical protein